MTRDDAAELAEAIRERLAARLEAARRRREDSRRFRAEKDARRKAGLKERHARKLRRAKEQGGQQ